MRKRSCELLSQVWELPLHSKVQSTAAQTLASVLTSAELQEKAIIGRLGLFIKKAILLETAAERRLQQAGYHIDWHTYAMPHAVHPEEIADVRRWLVQRLG